jgi:nitrogen fixation/metabolism regulation signal transduction histidine kinase
MKNSANSFFAAVLDAMPSPVFIVDEDVRIIEANEAALPLIGDRASTVYRRRGGEVLQCVHSMDVPEGCGRSPSCASCVVRNSVTASYAHKKIVRRAAKMLLEQNGELRAVYLLITTSPLLFEGTRHVVLTIEDVNELVELRRLIPICANCKKVRDEQEYWDSVESYFKNHLDMDFTHGICPECMDSLYPGMMDNSGPEKPTNGTA